ncbi:hypothetical protein BGX26_003344 [Mortierella sp. AD094]|nr:hypothetical protein BGX26_003344 [Mortierella sp. AD094]
MVQLPPPSHNASTSAVNTNYEPPTEPYYQAQSVGGQSQAEGYLPPTSAYAPPPSAYAPPTSAYAPPPSAYAPPPAPTGGHASPTVWCTWFGFLWGGFFICSPDPRERLWARACLVMAMFWSIFAITFGAIYGTRH